MATATESPQITTTIQRGTRFATSRRNYVHVPTQYRNENQSIFLSVHRGTNGGEYPDVKPPSLSEHI